MPGPKPCCTPNELAALAGDMLTQEEIAHLLGVTQGTISRLLAKPAYREAYERARQDTKRKLRRAQLDAAIENHDKTMLIWTGKQYLDQRDAPKEVKIDQDVQVTYIARWGGQPGGELPPAEGEVELIEGTAEDASEEE